MIKVLSSDGVVFMLNAKHNNWFARKRGDTGGRPLARPLIAKP
jgi:hypothetical protein